MPTGRLVLSLAALTVAGCVQRPVPATRYRAVIEQVEDAALLPTQHYSVRHGPTAATRLHLHLLPASAARAEPKHVIVLLLRLSAPAARSRAGDEVSFTFAGSLPEGRDVQMSELDDYRVVRRTQPGATR
jgi:hypothetical protein